MELSGRVWQAVRRLGRRTAGHGGSLGGMTSGLPRAFAVPVALACILFAPRTALAQPGPTTVDGFGVTYTAPAGWTLSGRDGRIHAWADADQKRALVVYAGHFAPLALALGDAQRVLGVPRDEDTQIVTPLSPARFGTRDGQAGSLRVTAPQQVLAHVAVVALDDSTALGAVLVMEGTRGTVALDSGAQLVATLLGDARLAGATADDALRARLVGEWAVQQSGAASASGGTYTNDESWAFRADGTYAYRKRFAVRMPGADVTPEERDEAGRWYAVGGALVLVNDEGRLTVDVRVTADALELDGTRFPRRP